MRSQRVYREGAVSFDREGNRVDAEPTFRDLIVIPTIPLAEREPTTESPMILTRAEIARRRDANNGAG